MNIRRLFITLVLFGVSISAQATVLYTAEFSLVEEVTGVTGSGYLTFDNDTVAFGQVRDDDVTAIFAYIAGANNIIDNVSSLTDTQFLGWDVNTLSFSSYTNFQASGLGWFNFGGQSKFSIQGLSNNVNLTITNVYNGAFSSVPEPTTLALMGLGLLGLGYKRKRLH